MLAYIEGKLVEAGVLRMVVDVGGLGYEVLVPVTTAERMPAVGAQVRLQTVAVYREDSQTLYGFLDTEDKAFFQLLVEKVSGIGPRIALSILSKLPVPTLREAIAAGDVKLLSSCPGIGKKTAERLVVELKDNMFPGGVGASEAVGGVVPVASSPAADAVAALVALGYKAVDADKSVRKATEALGPEASTEALIRAALG